MFADHLRSAVEASPRTKLPELAALLWRALAEGNVSEAEAEEIAGLIEARKAIPAPPRPSPARRGSRPRTDASLERRRRWAASGRLPPALAWRFTVAEQAVLALVAAEVAKHGRCTLAHGHLAAVAGVSVSSVKRAMAAAREAGLIEIEVRRVSAFRNMPNIVTVLSREWLSWLRLGRQGGGVQIGAGTPTHVSKQVKREAGGTAQGAHRGGEGGTASARIRPASGDRGSRRAIPRGGA